MLLIDNDTIDYVQLQSWSQYLEILQRFSTGLIRHKQDGT